MANHEFGIIQNQPMSKEKFYEYEPNKYSCIAVDDNFIEPILIDLQNVDCYKPILTKKTDNSIFFT